jgi:3-carboxy-cis,cis-muconate cycloisomerase
LPFEALFVPADVRDATGERAWVQAMLDFEVALARARGQAELADRIAATSPPQLTDPSTGNPVPELVAALPAGAHRGATSQDVMDTAAVLVAKRTLPLIDESLAGVAAACARLAADHRGTPMAARTLLQQALPTTFGLKAAGWLAAVDEARDLLDAVPLEVELGGAAGTLASFGDLGVLARLAEELDLVEPVLPWHTRRLRIGQLGAGLALAAGAIEKIALDVKLMAQTEVGELSESSAGGRGGSSTLPHKRNPVAAVSAVACAMRAPGLVAELLGAMAHEHERGAGPWHAEWRAFSALLETTGSACAWLRDCLEHLEVDAERMRANLELTHGALLAERVTTALAPALGRQAAHELVQAGAQEAFAADRPLGDVLVEDDRVRKHLDEQEVSRLLDPAEYLGATGELIDRALRAHAERAGQRA